MWKSVPRTSSGTKLTIVLRNQAFVLLERVTGTVSLQYKVQPILLFKCGAYPCSEKPQGSSSGLFVTYIFSVDTFKCCEIQKLSKERKASSVDYVFLEQYNDQIVGPELE